MMGIILHSDVRRKAAFLPLGCYFQAVLFAGTPMSAFGREQQFAMFPEGRRWKIKGIGVGQVSGL
jgi:hypothetical protein